MAKPGESTKWSEFPLTFKRDSISRFAQRHGLTLSWTFIEDYPDIPPDYVSSAISEAYQVVLRISHPSGKHVDFFWSISPDKLSMDLAGIMESLALDANLYEGSGGDMERFASEVNMDLDSPMMYSLFETYREMTESLREMLGEQAYWELLRLGVEAAG